jgi:hypothetical protein
MIGKEKYSLHISQRCWLSRNKHVHQARETG